jgi:hypothetical protein
LELGQHGLLGNHEDALATTALDEFGGQNPRFHGLTQTDRIGDQDTGARLAQRLKGGIELVGHQVHDTSVA